MAPKTKQLMFSPQMVAALFAAVLGGAGGTFGGFSAGSSKAEETKAVMEYRLMQVEDQLKAERAARLQDAVERASFDKRLTRLEDTAGRFEKQMDRFDRLLGLMGKR